MRIWARHVVGVGIVLAWGKNFSAVNYFLFDHLPYYNKFRAPAIALVMPQLAFPLLGALGLQQLISGQTSKEEVWKKFKTSETKLAKPHQTLSMTSNRLPTM